MKVRFTKPYEIDGLKAVPGTVAEVEDGLGRKLIREGTAKLVGVTPHRSFEANRSTLRVPDTKTD